MTVWYDDLGPIVPAAEVGNEPNARDRELQVSVTWGGSIFPVRRLLLMAARRESIHEAYQDGLTYRMMLRQPFNKNASCCILSTGLYQPPIDYPIDGYCGMMVDCMSRFILTSDHARYSNILAG